MQIDFFAEMRAFYRAVSSNQLSGSEISLWWALMQFSSSQGAGNDWPERITPSVKWLELNAGLSRDGVYRARNKLKQAGVLDFEARGGRQAAIYTLEFVSCGATQTATQSATQPAHNLQHNPHTKCDYIQTKTIPDSEEEEVDRVREEVFAAFEESICPLTPITREALGKWVDAVGPALVAEAITQGAMLRGRTMRYISSILEDWQAQGIRTVEQARKLAKPTKVKRDVKGSTDSESTGLAKKLDFAKYQAQRAYTPEQMGALYDDPEAL